MMPDDYTKRHGKHATLHSMARESQKPKISIGKRVSKPSSRHEVQVNSVLYMKRLHDELMTAGEVQRALLPQEYPDIPELEFSHRYIPMLGVGGDFFDVQELSAGVVEIFISDVMGHGPKAAIITGILKALLIQFSSSLAGPGYILSQINERFHQLMASGHLPMFVTAFCMVIDTLNKKYTYASAGHPAPFLIKGCRSEIERLISEPCPALGMTPNTCYEDYERTLEKEDMLFFFTDGLQELINRDKAQFAPEELQRAILSNMHLSPNRFLDAVLCAAYAFSGGLTIHDDMTLLAASYE